MADPNAAGPYDYPTPAMLQQYSADARRYGGAPGYATGTPLDTSRLGAPQATPTKLPLMQRIGRAWNVLITGADAANVLFPPQQPLQPIAQYPDAAVVGRPWDYQVGRNTWVTPRTGEPIGFAALQALAQNYDVLRLLIERVKDKIVFDPWQIGPRNKKGKRDKRCDELEEVFFMPDREHIFSDWARMLLEQVMVYDAPAIWLQPDRKGDLAALHIIDGSLISPKIGSDGRVPDPDVGPGYQQVIKNGLPACDYIKPVPRGQPVPLAPDGIPFPELMYAPRNPRVNSLYGYGPVEQMIATVNIAIYREAYFLSYYTMGSTPDLLIALPSTWNVDEMAKFKLWWDSVLQGNVQNRRGTMFVPDGAKPVDTKERILTDKSDEWLIRIMCFAFGLNPMPFIQQMNKGQEKTHHTEAHEEGEQPWRQWLGSLIDRIIRTKFGYPDLCFRWQEEEVADPLEQAQTYQIYVNAKVYHPDEVRAKLGEDAMPDDMREQMDMATFASTVNATILTEDQLDDKDQRAAARAPQFGATGAPAAQPGPPQPAAPGVAGKVLGKAASRPRHARSTSTVTRY
ncbi:MAG TPA: phage portal protein [Vicinamibacterales bacterium]|jgi:hypothetical protein|nr:phage portal protein [Vicinamibacterales bacterium]